MFGLARDILCCIHLPTPNLQLVDIRVENAIREADARRLVRVLVRQLDVDLPHSALERCYSSMSALLKAIYCLFINVLSVGPLNLT